MNEKSKELKPCPFCESGDLVFFEDNCCCGEQNWFMLGCDGCGLTLKGIEIPNDSDDDRYEKSKEDARTTLSKIWNRRAAPVWSAEPPTEPGWYWVQCEYGSAPVVVRVKDRGDVFVVLHERDWITINIRMDDFQENNPNTKWLKIAQPEEQS